MERNVASQELLKSIKCVTLAECQSVVSDVGVKYPRAQDRPVL